MRSSASILHFFAWTPWNLPVEKTSNFICVFFTIQSVPSVVVTKTKYNVNLPQTNAQPVSRTKGLPEVSGYHWKQIVKLTHPKISLESIMEAKQHAKSSYNATLIASSINLMKLNFKLNFLKKWLNMTMCYMYFCKLGHNVDKRSILVLTKLLVTFKCKSYSKQK